MKKLLLLVPLFALASCSNERSSMFSTINEYSDNVESLAKKVEKGDVSYKDVNEEEKKLRKTEREADMALEILKENKDLLTESEKSNYLDCIIRAEKAKKRLRTAVSDKAEEAIGAAKEAVGAAKDILDE